MPTKIYGIKINDFWINVSYSPPHYPRQKTKKSKLPKIDKCLQITTSFFYHRKCSLSTAQTSDISIAIHSNSIVRQRFTNVYDVAIELWIAIEMSEVCMRWKWSSFCDFWNWTCCDLKRIYLIFGTFLCFLTWVMRRTVANIIQKSFILMR